MNPARPDCGRYLQRISPTPLVPIALDGGPAIWCKLEFLNPSGSTKDRIARYILEKAWRKKLLASGDIVVEASSGSTSIALALACAQMGLRFLAFMPEGVSNERVLIIRAYGGDVRFTPAASGIKGAIAETERFAASGANVFLPRQFANLDNAEAHRLSTAREIADQAPGGTVAAFVSGVGTGGTLVGVCQGLRECGCSVVPVLARPINIRQLPDVECCSFSSRIPGVADSISQIFNKDRLDGLLTIEVNDGEALSTTQKLIKRGFPVGPSSGLNYVAAVQIARKSPVDSGAVVTIFADRMERYFTTELFRPYVEGGT